MYAEIGFRGGGTIPTLCDSSRIMSLGLIIGQTSYANSWLRICSMYCAAVDTPEPTGPTSPITSSLESLSEMLFAIPFDGARLKSGAGTLVAMTMCSRDLLFREGLYN